MQSALQPLPNECLPWWQLSEVPVRKPSRIVSAWHPTSPGENDHQALCLGQVLPWSGQYLGLSYVVEPYIAVLKTGIAITHSWAMPVSLDIQLIKQRTRTHLSQPSFVTFCEVNRKLLKLESFIPTLQWKKSLYWNISKIETRIVYNVRPNLKNTLNTNTLWARKYIIHKTIYWTRRI